MAETQPGLEIALVPAHHVHIMWPQVAALLEEAMARAPGRFSGGDLAMLLLEGRQQLWVVRDGETPVAAFTTRIYEVPQSRVFAIEWVGGVRLEEWIDEAIQILEQFARDSGCQKIEGHGRKGWEKILSRHGWHWLAVSFEKDLDIHGKGFSP